MKSNYLTGRTVTPNDQLAFARAGTQLSEQKIRYHSAWHLNNKPGSNLEKMSNRISKMLEMDQVITLDGWHECKDSVLEVHIARHFGIRVLHFTAMGMVKMKEAKDTGKIQFADEYPCSMCSLVVNNDEITANDGICDNCATEPAFI